MGKISNFIIGAAIGIAGGAVVNYLFGPTDDAQDDGTFRSRLDFAMDEGRKAAHEKEVELRRDFEQGKRLTG